MIEILFRVALYIFLLPVSLVVMTPIILVGAFFSKEGSYRENLKNGYRSVYEFWTDALICLF
ncbi:MAG: hypothetical protein R3F19_18465 [Verrucomicrobiales bacterium]